MKKPENIYVSTATQCIQKQKNKDEKHKPLETAAQKCSYTTEQQQQQQHQQQQQQQPQRRQRQRQQQQQEEEEYARMDSKQ